MLGETGKVVLLAASKVKVTALACHYNGAWLCGVVRGNGVQATVAVNPKGVWRLSTYRTLRTPSESCPQTALVYVMSTLIEHDGVGVVVGT